MRPALLRFLAAVTVAAAVLAPVPAVAGPTVPVAPRVVAASTVAAGTFLAWPAVGSATMFQVQQASDARFTRGVRNYALRDGRERQFTPPSLVTGATYWFRVRAANGRLVGRFSAAVRVRVVSRTQPVRVMTYNVLTTLADGSAAGTETVAPWAQRAEKVAGLIAQGRADFVALQEGSGWIAEVKGPRQVDDLVSRLGGQYALARTEAVPGERGWYRTGRYLLYRPAVHAPVGKGWHWDLGGGRWAAYQGFRHRTTGADLLLVSVHLTSGGGRTGDGIRDREMRTLIGLAKTHAGRLGGVPIVYAGDVNSHDGSNHAVDGPGNAARAARVTDAFKAAPVRTYAHVNSSNQYRRTPPMDGRSIDRVFASPGVEARAWRLLFNHTGGRFAGVIPSDHNPVVVDLAVPY